MSAISQFPGGGVERNPTGKKVEPHELHIHTHILSPFQKIITVVELVFVGWLLSLVFKAFITNITFLKHVL
jgi:hypothetical protein